MFVPYVHKACIKGGLEGQFRGEQNNIYKSSQCFLNGKKYTPGTVTQSSYEFKQWEMCIIAVAFNTLCGIKLMLLTHHTFLIVLIWAESASLFYLILQIFAFMKFSQNDAYWPLWVAIFISLVQGANHLNISLRKYRHIHFLTCQHSIEKLWHWCMFQLPLPPCMLEAHVQKPALLEIKMPICKWTDGIPQVQRHILGRISEGGGNAGRRAGAVWKGFLGDSDSCAPRPHCAALI